MSVRTKGDKIGMWLGDANVGESIITVGKRTKERLNIENQVRKKKEFFGIFCELQILLYGLLVYFI